MGKSLRASSRKFNNRKLKANVFGPVESARIERLSAKLMEIASQPKPERDTEMKVDDLASDDGVDSPRPAGDGAEMDVDSQKKTLNSSQRAMKKKIEKRKKTASRIVFPKYKDRKVKGKK